MIEQDQIWLVMKHSVPNHPPSSQKNSCLSKIGVALTCLHQPVRRTVSAAAKRVGGTASKEVGSSRDRSIHVIKR